MILPSKERSARSKMPPIHHTIMVIGSTPSSSMMITSVVFPVALSVEMSLTANKHKEYNFRIVKYKRKNVYHEAYWVTYGISKRFGNYRQVRYQNFQSKRKHRKNMCRFRISLSIEITLTYFASLLTQS